MHIELGLSESSLDGNESFMHSLTILWLSVGKCILRFTCQNVNNLPQDVTKGNISRVHRYILRQPAGVPSFRL